MGMFDSLYDQQGQEWQTKAYDCYLDRYKIGDRMPPPEGCPDADTPPEGCPDADSTYQVEVFGGRVQGSESIDSFATIRNRVLVDVPAERDTSLPLVDYYGALAVSPDWDDRWVARDE